MKALSTQEQKREKAWHYAQSRIIEKVLSKKLSSTRAGFELHMWRDRFKEIV